MVQKRNEPNTVVPIQPLLDELTVADDTKDQVAVLRKLAAIGGDAVYEALLPFLESRKGDLQYVVLSTLVGLNPARGQNLLIDLLDNHPDGDMRWVASSLLVNEATPEMLDSLIALLKHPDVRVRTNIVIALDKLGDRRALPALIHAQQFDTGKTDDGHSVRALADRAVRRIQERAIGDNDMRT